MAHYSTQLPITDGAADMTAGSTVFQTARLAWIWTLLPVVSLGYLLTDLQLASPRAGASTLPALAQLGTVGLCFALVLLGYVWMERGGGAAGPPRVRRWAVAFLAGLMGLGFVGFTLGSGRLGAAALERLELGFVLMIGVYLVGALFRSPAMQAVAAAATPAVRPWREVLRDYLSMTKPGLNGLVLTTTFIGFYLASGGHWNPGLCLWTLAGTGLTASGSSALNQFMERDTDGLMRRTASRPLPAGRLAPRAALLFGVALTLAGLATLATRVSTPTAFLGALTLGNYLFLYTPLKRISTLSTLAGAISGAIPPVMGWVAAGGAFGPTVQVLFFILFLWQEPHFLAIAWKYRDEYRAAGCPLYAVLDSGGVATAHQALLYTIVLVTVSLLPWSYGLTGALYGVGALALGVAFLAAGARFLRRPTTSNAMRLFFTSIIYLPLLLALLLIDARAGAGPLPMP